jgi:hypothetical protein
MARSGCSRWGDAGSLTAAAVLYTLIETAKVVGVDPARYVTEAATAAKRFGQVLLPAHIA